MDSSSVKGKHIGFMMMSNVLLSDSVKWVITNVICISTHALYAGHPVRYLSCNVKVLVVIISRISEALALSRKNKYNKLDC
jgi:hypothetical protein